MLFEGTSAQVRPFSVHIEGGKRDGDKTGKIRWGWSEEKWRGYRDQIVLA